MHRPRIGLRAGHKGLNADVHREAALHASEHVPGDDELLLIGLVEVVPDAQAGGARMGEQDVPLRLLAVLDHHIDHVAGLHRDLPVRTLKLLQGNDAFGLITEIDDDVFSGNAENGTL